MNGRVERFDAGQIGRGQRAHVDISVPGLGTIRRGLDNVVGAHGAGRLLGREGVREATEESIRTRVVWPVGEPNGANARMSIKPISHADEGRERARALVIIGTDEVLDLPGTGRVLE